VQCTVVLVGRRQISLRAVATRIAATFLPIPRARVYYRRLVGILRFLWVGVMILLRVAEPLKVAVAVAVAGTDRLPLIMVWRREAVAARKVQMATSLLVDGRACLGIATQTAPTRIVGI